MALTKEEREARIKLNQMLDKYSSDLKTIFDDITPITEAKEAKVSTLVELQNLMEQYEDRLSFLGKNTFSNAAEGDISVSIFLMSTKTVKVPEDENLISLGYTLEKSWRDEDYSSIRVRRSSASSEDLEKFMEMPIKPKDVKDEVSAKDLVRRCDASQFYKLYLNEALNVIRKLFPYPYGMFSGPHLYKVEDRKAGTLYVAYDKLRKKFRYAYNPDFILESAIEEWMLNRGAYKTLKDCYCYLLAFMITHEMLHIIHHNTVSDTGVDDSRLSTSDHAVANCVMDSFINCKIARRFTGAPQLRSNSRLAPMLSNGIGAKVSVRVEHNRGLKKFETLKDLSDELLAVIMKDMRLKSTIDINYYPSESSLIERNLSKLEGADAFITVYISPTLSAIRSNGSNLFQTCFNDIIKCITDGKAHDMYSKISDEEKISDLDILPVGTIVMVKGKRDVGIITAVKDDNVTYDINRMDISGVKKVPTDKGTLCVPEYVDSGNSLGTFSRIKIRPYNPEDDSYFEDIPDERQDKLTGEDLMSLNMPQEAPPDGGMPGMDEKPAKALKVGDIVWVRKVKKFGRIVSVDTGKFNVEEVIEKPCKVLDDSDNY